MWMSQIFNVVNAAYSLSGSITEKEIVKNHASVYIMNYV